MLPTNSPALSRVSTGVMTGMVASSGGPVMGRCARVVRGGEHLSDTHPKDLLEFVQSVPAWIAALVKQ